MFKNAFGHESIYLVGARRRSDCRRAAARAHQERALRPVADVAAVPELRRRRGRLRRRRRPAARRGGRSGAAPRCRHVELRHIGQAVSARCRAGSTRSRCCCRSRRACGSGSIARSGIRFGRRRSPSSTRRARRRGAARRVLHGVCAQHARPRHAGLFAAAVRGGARAVSASGARARRPAWRASRSPRG